MGGELGSVNGERGKGSSKRVRSFRAVVIIMAESPIEYVIMKAISIVT